MSFMSWARELLAGRPRYGGDPPESGSGPSPLWEENRRLWWDMYVNHPPWEDCEVRPLGLPGAVGRELARQALTEFQVTVSGSGRAEVLNRQMVEAENNFLRALELGLCLGGVAFKPYLENGRLLVDVSAANFTPTRFDGAGRAVGGVFRSAPVRVGKQWFVRLEYHDFLPGEDGEPVYVVRNRAFYSGPDGRPGAPAELGQVPEWAGLAAETAVNGLKGPLFAYFKPPEANSMEPDSKLGASVYAGAAAELIRQADEQWRLIRWEFQSGKRRIYVDGVDAGQFDDEIFVSGPFSSDGSFFSVFSPEFRDGPLYNGFQRILQRIEFQVGLAYGTISDPQCVEKTATEILAAKHRQYVTETAIQKAFQRTLEELLQAMDAWCDLAGLAPGGAYNVKFSWGDGVLDDPEVRRLDKTLDAELVDKGLMRKWEFRMKWFGESEADARASVTDAEQTADAAAQ